LNIQRNGVLWIRFHMKYWIMLYKQETRLSHGIRRININITFFVLDLRKMTVRRLPSVPNTVANHSVFMSGSYITMRFLLLTLIIHATKMKPPFHHEHRRRNHGWPNE